MKISHYILSITFAAVSFAAADEAKAQSGNRNSIVYAKDTDAGRKYPNKLSSDRMLRAEKKDFQSAFKGDRVTGPKYQGMGQPIASTNANFAKSRGYYSEKNVKKIAKTKEKAAPVAKEDKSAMAGE